MVSLPFNLDHCADKTISSKYTEQNIRLISFFQRRKTSNELGFL